MNRIARAALLLILGGVALGGRSEAGPLDPTQFASLGSLVLNPGSYTIDSSAGVLALNAGGSTFFGVISDGVAVFDFDSITIARGAVLTAAQGPGGLPIALLSRSFETINGTIDVSAFGNQAGPGASFFGVGGSGISGRDPAAGNTPGASGSGSSGAGGGGFGGAGGQGGQVNFTFPNRLEGGAGGDSYARLSSVLLGGSRGGTGFFGRNSPSAARSSPTGPMPWAATGPAAAPAAGSSCMPPR